MADYDFGELATPAKKAPAKAYDFGELAKPATKDESFMSKAANIFGGGEAALNLASGLIAKPVAEIGGLAAMGKELISPTPGGGDPEAFKKQLQENLTYQPRTDLGKAAAEYNPLAVAGKAIGAGANALGGLVGGDASADSARGMVGNAVKEAIPQAVGLALPALKKPVAGRLASEEASLAKEQTLNAPRDENVAAAREKGYVLPPSVAGVKGPLSSFFQAEAGSTKLDYGASTKNQRVTNGLIKKELGLPADEAITVKSLDDIRSKAGDAYKSVKQALPNLQVTQTFKNALLNPNGKFYLARAEFPDYFKDAEIEKLTKDLSHRASFTSDAAIEMQKVLRKDGYANLKAFDKPKQQSLGEAQINAAKAIDDLIDENLNMKAPPGVNNFQSKLATGLAAARKKIAQTYAVEKALNDQTGNVSARTLAKMWDKDRTLTGGLKDVAETSKAFQQQLRDVDKLPATANESMSNMDVGKAGVMTALGHGGLAAATTLGRMAVKPALLSDWYQQFNIKPPSYKPGAAYTAPNYLANNPGAMFAIPRPPQQGDQ